MEVRYNGITFDRAGHSSVRIEGAADTVIYIDPWSEVIDGSPADADIVITTHDDSDHCDPAAISAVTNDGSIWLAHKSIDTSELAVDTRALSDSSDLIVKDVHIRTLPAYNRPDGPHVREPGQPYHSEGEGIGFVLTIDGTSILYPGDTDVLDEHETVDAVVVIPPIGGSYTMDRHEAAQLVEHINPELVLPVHYNSDLVEGIDTDAEAFKNEVESTGPKVILL